MTHERNLDSRKPQAGGRLAGLDFIRAAACIGVLLFHMHLTLTGFISVTLFFAISGFLMTYNALDRDAEAPPTLKGSVAFALSRTKKLYKLYLITLIIPLLGQLYGVVSGLEKFDGMFVFRIASNILLLQSLVPDLNISLFLNGVAWYLSTSLFLYMAFSLYYKPPKETAEPRRGVGCHSHGIYRAGSISIRGRRPWQALSSAGLLLRCKRHPVVCLCFAVFKDCGLHYSL